MARRGPRLRIPDEVVPAPWAGHRYLPPAGSASRRWRRSRLKQDHVRWSGAGRTAPSREEPDRSRRANAIRSGGNVAEHGDQEPGGQQRAHEPAEHFLPNPEGPPRPGRCAHVFLTPRTSRRRNAGAAPGRAGRRRRAGSCPDRRPRAGGRGRGDIPCPGQQRPPERVRHIALVACARPPGPGRRLGPGRRPHGPHAGRLDRAGLTVPGPCGEAECPSCPWLAGPRRSSVNKTSWSESSRPSWRPAARRSTTPTSRLPGAARARGTAAGAAVGRRTRRPSSSTTVTRCRVATGRGRHVYVSATAVFQRGPHRPCGREGLD